MAASEEAAMVACLHKYAIGSNAAKRTVAFELRSWPLEDVEAILQQLEPFVRKGGSSEPCGPLFDRHEAFSWKMTILFNSVRATGIAVLLPVQVALSLYFLTKRRWKAIWEEVPRPSWSVLGWLAEYSTFIKTPRSLVLESIDKRQALCVNAHGKLKLMSTGYTVVSHVWAETMGWATPTSWGAVTLELRKKGMDLAHFRRIFQRCDAEWIWLDVIAMPEAFPDMSLEEASEVEKIRVDIINRLHDIYTTADKVVILDSTLLRLSSGSPVDAAVVLTLGRWITRLWPYAECRLAKRVVLKTADASFDLDAIIDHLSRELDNDQHRYVGLLERLAPLRPTPPSSQRLVYYGGGREDAHILEEVFAGTENRMTETPVDHLRAIFPVLDLKWQVDWSIVDGVKCIAEAFPDRLELVMKYLRYRKQYLLVSDKFA